MRPLFIGDTWIGMEQSPIPKSSVGPMTAGPIASSVLHLLAVLLLVFGLPWRTQAPPAVRIVPVDLVWLGPETAPPARVTATLPQAKAEQTAKSDPAEPVPVPQAPPPQAAERPANGSSTSSPTTAMKTARTAEAPVPPKKPTPDAAPPAKLKQPKMPDDDLSARLRLLSRLRQPEAPMPSDPAQQKGSGLSNLAAASPHAAPARDATYRVKDFIRAQVQRRWYMEARAIKNPDWVVAIHIVLNPNGSVSEAEIVDDARFPFDSAYRDFALSARNAVLLSSPITVPPGMYDIAKDIVVDFDAKQVLR